MLSRECLRVNWQLKMQIAGIAIERDSISRIENGTRFVADYELKIFAEVLNVDIVWLLAGIEETS